MLTEDELDYWREFHRLFPFDDLHRFYRPAALVFSAHAGKGAPAAFSSGLELLAPKPRKRARPMRRVRVIKGKP